jgi:hypothetical protein
MGDQLVDTYCTTCSFITITEGLLAWATNLLVLSCMTKHGVTDVFMRCNEYGLMGINGKDMGVGGGLEVTW